VSWQLVSNDTPLIILFNNNNNNNNNAILFLTFVFSPWDFYFLGHK